MGAARAVALVLLCLAGCDTRTQPAAAAPGGPVLDPERLSKEQETCSRTADCAEGLRCFDQVCKRTDRSVLGDYYYGLAALEQSQNDLTGALADYERSLAQYKSDGVTAPVDLECVYGATLVQARSDKDKAELAARVLHRCVLNAPSGSTLRLSALRTIATLDKNGLDPAHLARTEPADVYLSKSASAAEVNPNPVAEIKASPEPTAKTWAPTKEALEAAKPAFLACWTKGAPLAVTVPLETKRHPSEYDDEPDTFTVQIDPKAPAPASDPERCVRAAVTEAVKGVKGTGGNWTTSVVVTVQ